MENLKDSIVNPDKNSVNCINCFHCYIPNDFLLGLNAPELYCNINKDRPVSGDVMSEPFNYYDTAVYTTECSNWDQWAESNRVGLTNYCDKFERAT